MKDCLLLVLLHCGSKFQKKSVLQYHLRKHKNEEFICDFPERENVFLTSKHLKQHQKVVSYHNKLASCSTGPENCDDFFNSFEELVLDEDSGVTDMNTGKSFVEDFSPKSEKFLHIEEGRANASVQTEGSFEM